MQGQDLQLHPLFPSCCHPTPHLSFFHGGSDQCNAAGEVEATSAGTQPEGEQGPGGDQEAEGHCRQPPGQGLSLDTSSCLCQKLHGGKGRVSILATTLPGPGFKMEWPSSSTPHTLPAFWVPSQRSNPQAGLQEAGAASVLPLAVGGELLSGLCGPTFNSRWV